MSVFNSCSGIGKRGVERLLPFIRERSHNGQFVVTSKGPLARFLQQTVGDVMMNSDGEKVWAIEIKTEQEDRYGNLFLEIWSNKNLNNRHEHALRGSTPGWLQTLRADALFYYFLKSDDLYIIDLFKLKGWAFGNQQHQGHLYSGRFKQKCQKSWDQMNDTHGACVPISVIQAEVGLTHCKVAQLELFNEGGLGVALGELA